MKPPDLKDWPPKLYRSRSSSQQFLFSRTNSAAREEKPHRKSSNADLDELLKTFPDMLAGDAFLSASMDRLETVSAFCAMAVRIDAPGTNGSAPGKYDTNLLLDVARAIDSVCGVPHASGAIWGLMEEDIFGCVFPEKNKAACTELAGDIKKYLAVHCQQTVSIGIAAYPLLHFKKDRILENARKALDHAAFLGADSLVGFNAVSLNISGDKLYQKGNIHGAIEEFKAAILLDPSNVNLHNSLGVCYGVLGSFQKALEEFTHAIRLDEKEVMAIYNAGLVNMLTGNRKEALEYFLKADQLDENVFEVAFQTSRLYLREKRYEEAIKFLEKAIRLRPESGPALRYLGNCYAAMNMPDKAISAYKRAIRQNPYDAASLSAMGHMFDVQGENPEIAMLFCEHSVKISPENGLFRHRLGMLYMKQNRPDDALREFIKAKELGHKGSEKFIADIHQRLTAEAS
jgi:tetratricopeptide (TPR) repeat protein